MTKDEALRMALEALEYEAKAYAVHNELQIPKTIREAITAIKEALAQPEQEPVALETVYETIIQWDEGGGKRSRRELARRIVSLYTTPPQRKPHPDCDKCKAQPEQRNAIEHLEPVAWMYPDALCDKACLYQCTKGFTQFPECATPPQRKPLTDEQRNWIVATCPTPRHIIDTVEKMHGIKE